MPDSVLRTHTKYCKCCNIKASAFRAGWESQLRFFLKNSLFSSSGCARKLENGNRKEIKRTLNLWFYKNLMILKAKSWFWVSWPMILECLKQTCLTICSVIFYIWNCSFLWRGLAVDGGKAAYPKLDSRVCFTIYLAHHSEFASPAWKDITGIVCYVSNNFQCHIPFKPERHIAHLSMPNSV